MCSKVTTSVQYMIQIIAILQYLLLWTLYRRLKITPCALKVIFWKKWLKRGLMKFWWVIIVLVTFQRVPRYWFLYLKLNNKLLLFCLNHFTQHFGLDYVSVNSRLHIVLKLNAFLSFTWWCCERDTSIFCKICHLWYCIVLASILQENSYIYNVEEAIWTR